MEKELERERELEREKEIDTLMVEEGQFENVGNVVKRSDMMIVVKTKDEKWDQQSNVFFWASYANDEECCWVCQELISPTLLHILLLCFWYKRKHSISTTNLCPILLENTFKIDAKIFLYYFLQSRAQCYKVLGPYTSP